MTDQHAAPEGDAQVTPGAEPQGEPDLEALLAEGTAHEEAERAAPTAPVEPVAPDPTLAEKLDFVVGYVQQNIQKDQKAEVSTALDGLVDTLKADEDVPIRDDGMLRKLIRGHAAENPNFDKAYETRATNPRAWQVAQDQMIKDLGGGLKGQPDPQLTNDREAARAAVRTTSTAAPVADITPEDIRGMSDREAIAYSDKLAKLNR